jgi:hypothetical protein
MCPAMTVPGFGYVYILTVLCSASQGRFPIYDKYAHMAAMAIHEESATTVAGNNGIQRWFDYQEHMRLLVPIGNACLRQPGNPEAHLSASRQSLVSIRPLADRRTYDLRATFASRANACRASGLTVAHLLGHASTQILPAYVKHWTRT